MEFSQYVTEVIASIDHVEKDRDYDAVSQIKGAMKKADNEIDAHILSIISGSMTMTYNHKKQVFLPLLIDVNGNKSFAMEDIKKTDIDILRSVAQITQSSCLRTRFTHIIWVLTNEYEYGQQAVTGYLDAFRKTFDSVHWTTCYEKAKIAYHIASLLGKSSDVFKQAHSTIKQQLIILNGSDSLFLSIRLLSLILDDLCKEELPQFVVFVETLFYKNVDPNCENPHLSDEVFLVLEAMYKRLKRNNDIKIAKEQYAAFYETQSRKLVEKKDYFRAVYLIKKACTLYNDVNRDKVIALRLEMEEWQKLALKELHPITAKIDVKDTAKAIEQMFSGLNLSESIVQFGRMSRIYKADDVKQKLLQKEDVQLVNSIFGSTLLNGQGQSVQELPPLNNIDEESDVFRKHMIHYVAEQRRMFDSIQVRMAFHHLRQFGTISEDAIDFLVQDNAIIPDNRVDIIREGLHFALNGKLYTAMHILLPQTENIFRNLVKMCGDTVTFLKEDGSESFKPLSSLFRSSKLLECYDMDVIFTFQSIMDDPTGENLRNLNSHGLLEANEGNGVGALSFLSLLIMLLSLYNTKTLEIRRKLSEIEVSKT